MKSNVKELFQPMFITLLTLIVLEIVSTTFLPALGLIQYRFSANVLIILFLGFKLESPYIAICIFFVQYVHNFFSIEGWEVGTVAGILIGIIISYVKDVIHLTNFVTTIFVVELFQIVWFIITSFILYLKIDNSVYFYEKFWRFLPESIILALFAPLFFVILDQIWKPRQSSLLNR